MRTKTSIILTFFLTILFFNKIGFAQNKIIIGECVTVTLSSGATNFDDKDYLNFLKEAFNPEFSKQYSISHQSYKLENVIFRFNVPNMKLGRKKPISISYLKEVSSIWNGIYNNSGNSYLYKHYSAKIMTVNGNKILLGSYQDTKNTWNYQFVCFAPTTKRKFNGEILSLTPDVQLESNTLNNLFKSIEFKE